MTILTFTVTVLADIGATPDLEAIREGIAGAIECYRSEGNLTSDEDEETHIRAITVSISGAEA